MFLKWVVNHKKKRNSNENGFTLIEVLIAMVIFSIGILGVVKMQISAIQGNATAMKITEKYFLASNQIETLMSLPYDEVSPGSKQTLPGYTLSWTVNEIVADAAKQVIVTVTPPSGEDCIIEQRIPRIE